MGVGGWLMLILERGETKSSVLSAQCSVLSARMSAVLLGVLLVTPVKLTLLTVEALTRASQRREATMDPASQPAMV